MKRVFSVLVLIAFLAGVMATAALAGDQWQQHLAETRGIALRANSTFIATDDLPPLGVNAALQSASPLARERSIKLLQDGGFRLVRQKFPWRDIEPSKGVFRWERWDALVDSYRSHRLQVLAVLDEPPPWSRQDNNWVNRPPDDARDFGDFVAAFAARYRGHIDYLQIWDEPNVFPNWGNRPVDPAGYGALLAVAHERAKQANPQVKILLAGLAPNAEPGGRNMSDLAFLDRLYAAGAGPYFDIAAAKPYGLWFAADDRTLDPRRANFARVVQWREIMVARGDAGKPIWAVEFGWNALPESWAGSPSPWGRVSLDDQASHTLAAIQRAQAEWPWLPVLVLQGHFTSLPSDDPRHGFALVDAAGAAKPVYTALSQFAARPYSSVGLHRFSGEGIDLDDRWQLTASSFTGSSGATVRLSFAGTRLDLLVQMVPEGGVARVSVDGRPAPKLMKAGGAAWLDTRAQLERVERVTVAAGLPPGVHTFELSVSPRAALWPRSGDEAATVVLTAFDVVREPDFGPLPARLAGLVLVALALAWQIACKIIRWPWAPVAIWLLSRGRRILVSIARRLSSTWRALDADRRNFAALLAVLACLAATFAAPLAGLVSLLLIVAAVVALRPAAGLMALIVAAPFGALRIPVAEQSFAPAEVLAVILAFALLARWLPSWRRLFAAVRPFISSRGLLLGYDGAILLLLVASLLSALLAEYQAEAWRELRTVIAEPMIAYLAVVAIYSRRASSRQSEGSHDILRLVDVLVATGVLVSAIGLYQYFVTKDVITADGVYRLRALYGSPNNVGLFLGRIVPIAGCIATMAGSRRKPYLVALALILAAVTLTFSTGAWLGIGGAVVFALLLHGTRARTLVAAGATALAALGALLPAGRLASHLTLDQGTTVGRLLVWQGALNMLRDHPFFGVGPDNFLRHYRDHYMLPAAWREPNLSHAHNMFLDLLLRSGVIGLLAVLWLLARFFLRGIELWRCQKEPMNRMLILGLLAGMVDFVVHGLVDNSLFLTDLALVFWLTVGALEVLRRRHYNSTMSS